MATEYASAPPAAVTAPLTDRLPPLDQDFLRAAATVDPVRKDRYTVAERYYDGDTDHTSALTDRVKQYLERSGLPYNENFCETVVDTLAGRLRVSGVTSDSADFASYIWDVLWDRNRLDKHQGTFVTEALKKGDAYLIVDWDTATGLPTVRLNDPDRCKIEYVDGSKWYAAKTWDTSLVATLNPNGRALTRMNVYWPDRIEKYYRLGSEESGDWSVWVDDADPSWPIDWTAEGMPIGIPVFHLANKPGNRKFGRAEHWGTIPQQDRLVKELVDLSMILDTQGSPQRYATGTAGGAALKTNPGEVWSTESTDAVFGQFEAADPSGPLAAIESTMLRIAARSQTPIHLLVPTSTPPSGESTKTAEAGLVAKARDRQAPFGEELIGTFRMMAIVAVVWAPEGSEFRPSLSIDQIRRATLNVQWVDPETRNEKEHLEALALMKSLGVSNKTLLGMIPGIDADAELEQSQVEAEAAAAHMASFFASGGTATEPGQGRPVPPARPNGGTQPAQPPVLPA